MQSKMMTKKKKKKWLRKSTRYNKRGLWRRVERLYYVVRVSMLLQWPEQSVMIGSLLIFITHGKKRCSRRRI